MHHAGVLDVGGHQVVEAVAVEPAGLVQGAGVEAQVGHAGQPLQEGGAGFRIGHAGGVVGHLGPQPDGRQADLGTALLDGRGHAARDVEGGVDFSSPRRQLGVGGGGGQAHRPVVGDWRRVGAEPDDQPHAEALGQTDHLAGEGPPAHVRLGAGEH